MKPWIGGVEAEGPLARLAFSRIVVGGTGGWGPRLS